jgi:glycosyltransferase involved in cell wall biosynthesis
MKIAIAVQGRFHAFGLAEALLQRGERVTVMTNYPRLAAARFGLPPQAVLSFTLHGLVERLLRGMRLTRRFEAWLHVWFSKWVTRQCRTQRFDVVYVFSGVAEELFSSSYNPATVFALVRGSSHIRTQAQLLEDEERRVGHALDCPSKWRIAREEREYAMADVVVTLSSFSRDSFLEHGFPPDRVRLLVSAVSTRDFRPTSDVAEARRRRIEAGEPIRVLTAGTFSYRKGVHDLAAIVRMLPGAKFVFRFVGAIAPDAGALARSLKDRIDFVSKQSQSQLPAHYAWGDIFLYPTIEDGFPAVLAQAAASGLPILTTPNGAGEDLVSEGLTGWILPIRSPEAFAKVLVNCEAQRHETAKMAAFVYSQCKARDFSDMAADFIQAIREVIPAKSDRNLLVTPRAEHESARTIAHPSSVTIQGQRLLGLTEESRAHNESLKIAIVVHGRFYAFDLARELIRLGHSVCLLTNYPKTIAERFGIPRSHVRRNLLHGVISRLTHKIESSTNRRMFEPLVHRWFSRWAARIIHLEDFEVVHVFSGVCEEVFKSAKAGTLKTLVRGSAHIEDQAALLCAEEKRAGVSLDKPSEWMRAREAREYELADVIFVLSSFARQSFINRGVASRRLRVLPLGSDVSLFRGSGAVVRRRSERMRSVAKLRVLTVGNFSRRKGAADLARIAKGGEEFAVFRFVGGVASDSRRLRDDCGASIEFFSKVPQFDLSQHYEWGDIFLFPTIEDGYAVVLAQASAAGLPILATTNCGAPDLVKGGQMGWVFPIRRPDLFIEQLKWCDQNREELAAMVEATYNLYAPRDWSDVARDFVDICAEAREETNQRQVNVARA